MIVWFTGLPCSGKTTIAKAVERSIDTPLTVLGNDGYRMVELLDGDDLRGSDFSKGIGFSKEERETHLLRVGYMAKKLSVRVPYVLCSFVSPFEDTRKKLPVDMMVYVKCSAEECAKRDVKGMWAKAIAGEMKGFTGHDAPYEEPVNPDLVLDTHLTPLKECVKTILDKMKEMNGRTK